jgi:hypothetical protein
VKWLVTIALIAVTGSALAADQQHQLLTVTPWPPPKSNQQNNQPNQQQVSPDQRGTHDMPFFVKQLSKEYTEEELHEIYKKAGLDAMVANYTGDLAFYTECLFAATLLLALLTGVLTFAAFRQMREGRDAINAAMDTANHMGASVAHAGRSADALEGVAASIAANTVTTQNLLERQQRFSQMQMRAYIFVQTGNIYNVADPPTPTPAGQNPPPGAITLPDRGPIVQLAVVNSGHTPANNVINHLEVVFREFPLIAPLPEPQVIPPHLRSIFSVPPGGKTTKNHVFAILTADQIAALRANTSAMYIYGRITYTDIFGIDRETNYRFRHNAMSGIVGISGELTGTEQGNNST